MREPQTFAVDFENPRPKGLRKSSVEAGPGNRRLDDCDARGRKRSDGARHLECPGANAINTRVQELLEPRRDRELVAELERAAPAAQGSCKLQREERIAARRLPHSDQHRPRERGAKSNAKQFVQRAETQPTDRDRSQPVLRYGATDPSRQITADRQQDSHRRVVQAGKHITQRSERRRVQPLDVVDRDTQRTVAREQPQSSKEGGGHRPIIRGYRRLSEQQCGLEGPPLNRR